MNTAVERARAHIARRKAVKAADTDAPKCSDAQQIAAVYAACDNALNELNAKRDQLVESQQYTTTGIIEALRPEVERLRTELEALDASVLEPRRSKLMQRAEGIQTKANELVATPQDEALAERYMQLPGDQRRRLLGNALAGKDERLARALATAHPLVASVTDESQHKLRSMFTGVTDADEQSVLDNAQAVNAAGEHLQSTITKIAQSI